MHEQYIKRLIGIKDEHLKIRRITEEKDQYHIHIEYTQGHQTCPKCGSITSKVHDYRIRKIKHGVINGRYGILYYKRRRYHCKSCATRFPEPNLFVSAYAKISTLTKKLILKEARVVRSNKDIGKSLNISISTVIRHIDLHIQPKRLMLPETLSIDEFKKSNLGYGKYAFMMVNPISGQVIDIIKNRRSDWLTNYFSRIPQHERYRVKYIIMDLWQPYKTIIKNYFPKAQIIADRFHYMRYIYWAFNHVRVRIMKSLSMHSIEYKLLKKHWKLLLKSPHKLNSTYYVHPLLETTVNDYTLHDIISNMHPDLAEAMYLKDLIQSKIENLSIKEAPLFIDEYIGLLRHTHLKEFNDVKKTFINWREEIIKSFTIHPITHQRMTNGIIEGINNYVKVIKRVAFGYHNFQRFRNRIMYIYNKDYTLTA